jgi:hypothetical protein
MADHLELSVEIIAREQARLFVEWCFNSLEPLNVDAMPRACAISREEVSST